MSRIGSFEDPAPEAWAADHLLPPLTPSDRFLRKLLNSESFVWRRDIWRL